MKHTEETKKAISEKMQGNIKKEQMADSEIRLAIYLDMDKSILTQQTIQERVEEIFQYIKNGLTKYEL